MFGNIKHRLLTELRLWWHYKYRIFCGFIAFVLAFCCYNYVLNRKTASADVSLNYLEASSGLNPNNTKYNVYEVFSDEILENAIRGAGLGDRITADRLSGCIGFVPVDTGSASGDNYIATTYRITLNAANLDLGNIDAAELLKSICMSYRTYFVENYCDNQELLTQKLEKTDSGEPYLRLVQINQRINEIEKCLTARVNENKTFTDSNNNTFSELNKRIKNIVDYDIPNTTVYVIENGVAEDARTLSLLLSYKNRLGTMESDKDMEYYAADNRGVLAYEKAMTAIIVIPTTDENGDYYMSRTKTAMDELALSADRFLRDATSVKKEIVSTSYYLNKVAAAIPDEDKPEEVEAAAARLAKSRSMINSLEESINALSKDLFVLDKEFINYKAQSYLTFNYSTPSFIESTGFKRALIGGLFILACAFVMVYIKLYRDGKNENEKI